MIMVADDSLHARSFGRLRAVLEDRLWEEDMADYVIIGAGSGGAVLTSCASSSLNKLDATPRDRSAPWLLRWWAGGTNRDHRRDR